MKIQKIIGAGAIGLASIVAAYAHGGATGIVKERMEAMGTMSDVVKALSAMMRGETAYNADAVRDGAETIRRHAGEALTGLFPEGSGGEPSEAKAEVWSNWDEFSALAAQLETLSEGLGLAADNGLMSGSGGQAQGGMMGGGTGMMGSANTMMGGTAPMMGRGGSFDAAVLAAMPADGVFNMIAQSCSACHTKFRLEKN
ncbi:MAG: cytochrome C [Ahrensia sp.]|jgi:cytochrome c556|nr:cytochrome C [Ahrensia sp.]